MNYVAGEDGRVTSVPVGMYNHELKQYTEYERAVVWPGGTVSIPADTPPKDVTSEDAQTFVYAGASGVTLLVIGALLPSNRFQLNRMR